MIKKLPPPPAAKEGTTTQQIGNVLLKIQKGHRR